MLSLSSAVRIFVCREATDMRCSFERLSGMVKGVLEQDPLSGHLFVFVNRVRDSVKILYWDRSGYAIWYKRLESGRFSLPGVVEIESRDLSCMLEGFEPKDILKKKRFFLKNNEIMVASG